MVTNTTTAKRRLSEADKTSGSLSSKKPRVKTVRTRNEDVTWNSMYERIVAYRDEFGHCNVPERYEPDTKLGMWVQKQRQRKKARKMSDERFQKLELIGFKWALVETFDSMFDRIVAYKNEHGHCKVPQTDQNYSKLGNWVNAQRMLKKAGNLSQEQIEKLDSIGFVWIRHKIDTFDSMCGRLCAYKEAHGHCKVPTCYKEDGKLGRWVSNQRKLKKIGKLLPERIEKLNSIGFVWSARAAKAESVVTIKQEYLDESQPKLKVWVEDTGDPNYI